MLNVSTRLSATMEWEVDVLPENISKPSAGLSCLHTTIQTVRMQHYLLLWLLDPAS